MTYTVKLTYFKQSGKYYPEGEYETERRYMIDIQEEVITMMNTGTLPGLVLGATEFIVLMDVPKHPHDAPVLLGI